MKSINKVNCSLKSNFNTLSTIMTIPSREIRWFGIGGLCACMCVGVRMCSCVGYQAHVSLQRLEGDGLM